MRWSLQGRRPPQLCCLCTAAACSLEPTAAIWSAGYTTTSSVRCVRTHTHTHTHLQQPSGALVTPLPAQSGVYTHTLTAAFWSAGYTTTSSVRCVRTHTHTHTHSSHLERWLHHYQLSQVCAHTHTHTHTHLQQPSGALVTPLPAQSGVYTHTLTAAFWSAGYTTTSSVRCVRTHTHTHTHSSHLERWLHHYQLSQVCTHTHTYCRLLELATLLLNQSGVHTKDLSLKRTLFILVSRFD